MKVFKLCLIGIFVFAFQGVNAQKKYYKKSSGGFVVAKFQFNNHHNIPTKYVNMALQAWLMQADSVYGFNEILSQAEANRISISANASLNTIMVSCKTPLLFYNTAMQFLQNRFNNCLIDSASLAKVYKQTLSDFNYYKNDPDTQLLRCFLVEKNRLSSASLMPFDSVYGLLKDSFFHQKPTAISLVGSIDSAFAWPKLTYAFEKYNDKLSYSKKGFLLKDTYEFETTKKVQHSYVAIDVRKLDRLGQRLLFDKLKDHLNQDKKLLAINLDDGFICVNFMSYTYYNAHEWKQFLIDEIQIITENTNWEIAIKKAELHQKWMMQLNDYEAAQLLLQPNGASINRIALTELPMHVFMFKSKK